MAVMSWVSLPSLVEPLVCMSPYISLTVCMTPTVFTRSRTLSAARIDLAPVVRHCLIKLGDVGRGVRLHVLDALCLSCLKQGARGPTWRGLESVLRTAALTRVWPRKVAEVLSLGRRPPVSVTRDAWPVGGCLFLVRLEYPQGFVTLLAAKGDDRCGDEAGVGR